MKPMIFVLTLALVSANAFAAAKHCEGANSDFNTKGLEMNAVVTQQSVTVDDSEYAGTYPVSSSSRTVKGKDGKTYLVYKFGGEEGCTEVLVDQNLLKVKGQGWIKFRCRGEGFGDTKFFCNPK